MSDANRSEPRSSWMQEEGSYNTAEVLRQLGATKEPLSHAERGILSLAPESIYDAIENEVKPAFPLISSNTSDFASAAVSRRGDLLFCSQCSIGNNDMDKYWDNLFRQALNETNSPARAIQAVYTAKARHGYMQFAAAYTQPQDVTVASLNTVQVPTQVSGYTVVIVVITVQLALLVVAGVQFARTQNTIIGNAWLVVSQVSSSPEVTDLLSQAETMTDDEVQAYTKAQEAIGMEGQRSSGRFVIYDGTFRRKPCKGQSSSDNVMASNNRT